MSSALLLDNILKDNTLTITHTTSVAGFEFKNVFDNNAHTSFKAGNIPSADVVTVDFGGNVKANGFAVYGHNMTGSMSIKFEISSDNSTYNPFISDSVTSTNGVFSPPNSRGHAFASKGTTDTFRYLKITFTGFAAETFVSLIRLGVWFDGVNLSAPFPPPYFQSKRLDIKRNMRGNPMPATQVKVPVPITLNLNALTEEDLESTTSPTVLGDDSLSRNFVEYVADNVSTQPFFLMWNTTGSNNTATILNETQIYFCHITKQIRTPTFTNSTQLNWQIQVMGYVA